MGLVGMLIIEPNRPNNNFTHLALGAGRMPDLAKATVDEGYDRDIPWCTWISTPA